MIQLKKQYIEDIIAHVLKEDPKEACGLIAGVQGYAVNLYHMENIADSPYKFSMNPNDLLHINREIDTNGWDLLAIYHSHTHSEAYPSSTDVKMATWPDGKSIWPKTYYVLISLLDKKNPKIRAFRIIDGVINEESLQII